jgi:hypothetical protein
MNTNKVGKAVSVVMPGSAMAHSYHVVRTHDGKLRFRSDRTIGIYNPKNGVCYYSSRGNTDVALKNKSHKVSVPTHVVEALDSVAELSDRARRRLLS